MQMEAIPGPETSSVSRDIGAPAQRSPAVSFCSPQAGCGPRETCVFVTE